MKITQSFIAAVLISTLIIFLPTISAHAQTSNQNSKSLIQRIREAMSDLMEMQKSRMKNIKAFGR